MYVVTPSGDVLDQLNNGNWTRSEITLGGHHLATLTQAGVVFTQADWVGTERLRSDVNGVPCEEIISQPFGDNTQKIVPSGSAGCDPTPDFWTGRPRDTESDLDQFEARYFSSHWGRWMSPDWSSKAAAVPYVSWGNPQSLNLYAYVGNDPISGADPDGHMTFGFGDGTWDNYGSDGIPARQQNEIMDAEVTASAGALYADQFVIRVDTWATALPPAPTLYQAAPPPASMFFYELSLGFFGAGAMTAPACASGPGCAVPTAFFILSGLSAAAGETIQVIHNTVANSDGNNQDGSAANDAGQGTASGSQTTTKPEAQSEPGTKRDRSLEGTQQQLKDMERAQKNQYKTKRSIDDISKSQQNLKSKLKKIKSLSDLEE